MAVHALIYWSDEHAAHGLPTVTRTVDPAWPMDAVPRVDEGWSLICEFDSPPSVQGNPSEARVHFLVEEAPHGALTEGAELRLFERRTSKFARVVITGQSAKSDVSPHMISKADFAKAVEAFIMELPGFTMAATEAHLRSFPALAEELDEYIAGLRDPNAPIETIFSTAAGLIDEYVGANWDKVIDESYALYVDLSGGRSHRHPGRQTGL